MARAVYALESFCLSIIKAWYEQALKIKSSMRDHFHLKIRILIYLFNKLILKKLYMTFLIIWTSFMHFLYVRILEGNLTF